MEQLQAGFFECDEISYLRFKPIIVRYYRIIIIFHCPLTKKIREAISFAKSLNKKILFDIDDLTFNIKYADIISFRNSLSKKQKKVYDDKVNKMRKTLKLYQGAITTTETLAKELKYYMSNVFANPNVAGEKMWRISENALRSKNLKKKDDHVVIGYFSDRINHNKDLEMVKPVLFRILKKYKNVQLLLLGAFSFDNLMDEFPSQISIRKFEDWEQLQKIIANIDINIVPIENSTFNFEYQNKWIEAALVKVPTIASNYVEINKIIKPNETGFLCSDLNDWHITLESLINNESLRKNIGIKAYQICKEEYNTLNTYKKFVEFINSISAKHIGFFLPSINISGGVYVALKHALILKEEGWDVDLIVPKEKKITLLEFEGHKLNVISLNKITIVSQYDIVVATFFSTLFDVIKYYKAKYHFYLVQGYETNFFHYGNDLRISAEKTYSIPFNIKYITISKWCHSWLWKKYNKNSSYIPNGIDFDNIKYHMRNFNKKKIRILIEGDSSSFYKNVDESFKIVENLDKNQFEIWYLSYKGKPKSWYYVNKFFYKIPHEKIYQIYYESDILLKSSWLESFSYPPLEMMATGGYSIVVPNEGNKEYLKDGENCLFYKLGDINDAVRIIIKLISDKQLQEILYKNGLETAKKRDWKNLRNQIINLYDI